MLIPMFWLLLLFRPAKIYRPVVFPPLQVVKERIHHRRF